MLLPLGWRWRRSGQSSGIFFATSRLTHLSPQEFFGTAFWLGFTLHLIAAEAWVRYTREMRPGRSPLSPSRMGS